MQSKANSVHRQTPPSLSDLQLRLAFGFCHQDSYILETHLGSSMQKRSDQSGGNNLHLDWNLMPLSISDQYFFIIHTFLIHILWRPRSTADTDDRWSGKAWLPTFVEWLVGAKYKQAIYIYVYIQYYAILCRQSFALHSRSSHQDCWCLPPTHTHSPSSPGW